MPQHTLDRGLGRRFGLLDSSTVSVYPPRDGLLGFWNFNEASGSQVYDSSGNRNFGTFSGTNLPRWTPGRVGSAISMSAARSWVDFGATASLYVPSLSVGAWIKYTSAPNIGSALDMNNQANYGWVINIHQDGNTGAPSTGKIAAYTYSGGWVAAYTTAAVLSVNVWTHVMFTYNAGGTTNLYINGSTTGTVAASRPAGIQYNNNLLTFGREVGGNTNQYYGYIDEAFIYNRVLTQREINILSSQ